MKTKTMGVLLLAVLAWPQFARAAIYNMNYCVRVMYKADYEGCGGSSEGARYPANCDNSDRNFNGLVVEVWDRNLTVGDTKLADWTLWYSSTTSGYECIPFQWNTATAPPNDYWPDPYIKTRYKVKHAVQSGSQAEHFTQLCASDRDQNGNCPLVLATSWRDYYWSDCAGNCYEPRKLMISTSSTSLANKRAMVLRCRGRNSP